jgi:hypothetical protein
MDVHEYIAKHDFQKLIQDLEQWMNFKHWGFELVYSNPVPKSPVYYIVYQSNQCKVRFIWSQDRPYESPRIHIDYGRLHAPIDKYTMLWNNEERYCWHDIGKPLNFLDNISPSEIEKNDFKVPPIMKSFFENNKAKASSQPQKYIITMHAYIWEKYGQKLFNLLDLRYPNLWNEYCNFLEQYYLNQAKKAPMPFKPPLYKVC